MKFLILFVCYSVTKMLHFGSLELTVDPRLGPTQPCSSRKIRVPAHLPSRDSYVASWVDPTHVVFVDPSMDPLTLRWIL